MCRMAISSHRAMLSYVTTHRQINSSLLAGQYWGASGAGGGGFRWRRDLLWPGIQPRRYQFLTQPLEFGRARLCTGGQDIAIGYFQSRGEVLLKIILDAILHNALGRPQQQEEHLIAGRLRECVIDVRRALQFGGLEFALQLLGT